MLQGYLLTLASGLLFTASTVFAKFINQSGNIDAQEISFVRFFVGLIIVILMRCFGNYAPRPIVKKGLYLRAIYNTIAVILFYLAVQYSTITNANLLNMTYPVFVAIASAIVLDEKITIKISIAIVLSMLGAFLIIKPFNITINFGDIFGILSAIITGLAIAYLKFAVKTEDTFTILYYLFFYGTLITLVVSLPTIKIPNFKETWLLLLTALSAAAGQWLLTQGMKTITATVSSIISMTRIFFAAFIGMLMFGEIIDIYIIIGAILIITPNIMILTDSKLKQN